VLKQHHGFTLVELLLVTTVIIVLAVLLLPLGKKISDEAAHARAKADLFAISTALSNFFGDLDHFPACDGGDCATLTDSANNLRFLAFCSGSASCAAEYPDAPAWNLAGNQENSAPATNNVYNHLAANKPGFGPSAKHYRDGRWKGPYLSNLGADPYGKAYIVHVGAMEKNGCPVGSTGTPPDCFTPARGTKGWILSAGPNGIIETPPNATEPVGDDVGMILFSR
jgi:type II secretory pathway pseudopilin PulG